MPSLRLAFPAPTVLAATGAVLSISSPAEACGPECSPTALLPGDGKSIPASTPGLGLSLGVLETEATVGFELRDGEGALVDGALKHDPDAGLTFVPTSPLSPGAYSARFQSDCQAPSEDARPFFATSAFEVGEAKPLPTSVGALRVAHAERRVEPVATSSGMCVEDVDAGMVDLALDPDPALTPFEAALVWKLTVDGAPWAVARGALPTAPPKTAMGLLRLFTPCDKAGSAGRHPGLGAGAHDVELAAALPGAAAPIASAKLRVNVSCGDDNGTVPSAPAPEEPQPEDPAPVIESSGGCAAAPSGARSATSLGAVLLGLGLALSRRARGRSARARA